MRDEKAGCRYHRRAGIAYSDFMDFNLDPTWLFVSLIIGGIGYVAFMYGKKQGRMPAMAAGIALIVFPYFVSSTPWMIAIATGILAALWAAVRAGW